MWEFFSYALALGVAFAIAALIHFAVKSWLAARERSAKVQSELIDRFHRSAMQFMKLTNDPRFDVDRKMLLEIGDHLLDRGWLLHVVLKGHGMRRKQQKRGAQIVNTAEDRLGQMTEEQRHALAGALGAALLLSAERDFMVTMPIFGRFFCEAIMLSVDDVTKEANDPEQLVYRFEKGRIQSGKEVAC